MSQVFLGQVAGSPPPFVVNSYTVDFALSPATTPGQSIPSDAGVEVINGGSGIDVFTPVQDSNQIVIQIKNSQTNSTGQTVGFESVVLSTFDCSAVGTYKFVSEIAAFESTGPNGAGVTLYTTIISDGTTATVIGDSDPIAHITPGIELDVIGGAIDYAIVGSGTNALLTVTGTVGFTIDWGSFTVYVYRG